MKTGSSHDPLNVKRCGVWNRDRPRAKLLSGPRLLLSPAPTNVASDVSSIDLLHVYVAENPEGYRYSFDYTKREAVSGLALFPNLGLRGEL